MKATIFITILFLVSGCASIDHTDKTAQSLNTTLLAGVGDVILKIERERNLENAFGKADIFGRKTKEGYTEIRFAGVEQNGSVILYRKDVDILTNETTMSRTPVSSTNSRTNTSVSGAATTYGNTTSIQGSATTNYSSTTLQPLDDFHVVVPSGTVAIRLEPGESKLPVSGYVIDITNVSMNSLEYKVWKQK